MGYKFIVIKPKSEIFHWKIYPLSLPTYLLLKLTGRKMERKRNKTKKRIRSSPIWASNSFEPEMKSNQRVRPFIGKSDEQLGQHGSDVALSSGNIVEEPLDVLIIRGYFLEIGKCNMSSEALDLG